MTVTRYATLGGKPLLDPFALLQSARKNSTPTDFWRKANSYTNPRGCEPGRAFVLLSRADFVALNRNGLHSLVWYDGGVTTTFADLVIVRADCMTLAPNSDPGSAYLVELADKRLQMKLSAINAQYNVHVPAGPRNSTEDYYYPESLNEGILWTWQTMADDIWGNLPGIAGASPTLPYFPDPDPADFRFIGVSALEAYCQILERIGCDLCYNPFTGQFSVVRLGEVQDGLAAAAAVLPRVYDYDPLSSNRADSPATIRVFFHKVSDYGRGTELDTPRNLNWEMYPVHEEDVPTNIVGAEAGTVKAVWDNLQARVDFAGNVLNTSELASRAAEIAANWANIAEQDIDRVHYAGCVTTILPGSEVSKVVWRDYGDGYGNAQGGLITEVHRDMPDRCGCGAAVNENLSGPDLARHSHPIYPDLAQQLVVYHESSFFGEFKEANSGGVHPGYVLRVTPDSVEYLAPCWILFTDNFHIWAGNVLAVQEEVYGPGRLSGTYTVDGVTYPLYRVTHGERHWEAVNTEQLAQGESCEVEIYYFDTDAEAWGATGITWDAWDWFLNDGETIEAPTKMIVKWEGPILVITAAYCAVTDDPIINPGTP